MDLLSKSNPDFDAKQSSPLLKSLSLLPIEKPFLEAIASHLENDYLKNIKEDLPILYIVNKKIFILNKNKNEPKQLLKISRGEPIGEGGHHSLFNVDERALKVHLTGKNTDSLKKSALSLIKEEAFLSKIHQTSFSLGVQKKITLKKVYDICRVDETGIESLRKNLCEKEEPSLEINIGEGVIYRGTLEDFINNCKNNEEYPRNISQMQSDLASGLDLIHGLNIVHGDIKHKNIFYELTPNKAHAYLADFGSADEIIPTDYTKKISAPLRCALACTIGTDIGEYNSPARLLNTLIGKKILTLEEKKKICALKTHCLLLRKQIDVFQLGVVFYQMATRNTQHVPYLFIKNLGPQDIEPEKVKKSLGRFYKDEAKIECILLMLASDPTNRPSAKKIKELFSFFQ